jgi:hypothetical protein
MELDNDTQPFTSNKNTKAVTLDAIALEKLRIGKNQIVMEVHAGSKNVVSFDALFETKVEKLFDYGTEWFYYHLPYSKKTKLH